MADKPETFTDEQGKTVVKVPEGNLAIALAIVSICYLLACLVFLFREMFHIWAGDSGGVGWLLGCTDAEKPFLANPTFKLLAFTVIGGAMGGVVNGIRSFLSWHCDAAAFGPRYIWKYITFPFLGAALALFVYALVRAGIGAVGGGVGPGSGGTGHSLVVLGIGVLSGYGARNAFIWLDAQVSNLFAVKLIAVPSVVGQTEKEARSAIEQAGLTVGSRSTKIVTDLTLVDRVVEQVPETTARLAPKVAVNLTVGAIAANAPEVVEAKTLMAPELKMDLAAAPVVSSPKVMQVDTGLYEIYYSESAHGQRRRDVTLFSLEDRKGCFHRGSMQIDVDGSPRAYIKGNGNPLRLDDSSNADSEGGSSTYIQGQEYDVPGQGKVIAHGPNQWKGFYVSATSLRYSEKAMWDCDNFLDAESIPYFIYPYKPSLYPQGRNGIRLGDVGIIVHVPDMKWTPAIFGDNNDAARVSEASLAVAVNLGRSKIDPQTLLVSGLTGSNGDDDRNYFYLYFPDSAVPAQSTAPHWPASMIEAAAKTRFMAWGGLDMVRHCLEQM